MEQDSIPVEQLSKVKSQRRYVATANTGDNDLGPLKLLPGMWKNDPNLPGRGWNFIALPFAGGPFNYRLLVNQYNEELKFSLVDKGVPNRGINANVPSAVETDQLVVTLDYEQMIAQIAAEDFPQSGKAGGPGLPIHHEPGLWLHMLNYRTNGLDIARLASIPHGNSVLALGKSDQFTGAPTIPPVNGLPVGRLKQDLSDPYLEPYKHFDASPFMGAVPPGTGFPGFNPVEPHKLLELVNQGVEITRTTQLSVDTSIESGGISNLPFVVRQADASEMRSTFWIQELAERDAYGKPKLRLQYLQIVILDFFSPRQDGFPGVARWPHVSINTLDKVDNTADTQKAKMPDR